MADRSSRRSAIAARSIRTILTSSRRRRDRLENHRLIVGKRLSFKGRGRSAVEKPSDQARQVPTAIALRHLSAWGQMIDHMRYRLGQDRAHPVRIKTQL